MGAEQVSRAAESKTHGVTESHYRAKNGLIVPYLEKQVENPYGSDALVTILPGLCGTLNPNDQLLGAITRRKKDVLIVGEPRRENPHISQSDEVNEEDTQAVSEVIEQKRKRVTTLIGQSRSTILAAAIAASNPDKFNEIALVAPAIVDDKEHPARLTGKYMLEGFFHFIESAKRHGFQEALEGPRNVLRNFNQDRSTAWSRGRAVIRSGIVENICRAAYGGVYITVILAQDDLIFRQQEVERLLNEGMRTAKIAEGGEVFPMTPEQSIGGIHIVTIPGRHDLGLPGDDYIAMIEEKMSETRQRLKQ